MPRRMNDMVRPLPQARPSRPMPKAEPELRPEIKRRRPSGSRHYLWVIAGISFLFLVFAVSFLFSKATISITPKTDNLILDDKLTAVSDESNTNNLSFSLLQVPGEETKTLVATTETDVSETAAGKVLIYNNYSSAPQRLDINTRLLGSNGKTYKTDKAVVVPGLSGNLPGSIEVSIHGAEAGDSYNSPPLDFTILGFKGTPKYSKIYGRSEGEITGGYIGKAPAVSDADKSAAITSLAQDLKDKLVKKLNGQVAPGFVLWDGAIFFEPDSSNVSSVYNKDNSLTLSEKGTIYGLVFNEDKIAKRLAKDNLSSYDGGSVYVANISELKFTLVNKDADAWQDVKNVSFNLSGSALLVHRVDTDKLTTALLGKSKKEFLDIMSTFPNIASARLGLSPIWRLSIPEDPKEIQVFVDYPAEH